MIKNISITMFMIHWVGAFFQIPAILPYHANPILLLQVAPLGIYSSRDMNFEFLSREIHISGLSPINDEYEMNQNEMLEVDPPGVMENDTFDEGAISVLVDGALNGEAILQPDGSFEYTPVEDFIGIDTFSYRLELGEITSEIAVVQITVLDTQPPQVEWVSPVPEGEVLMVGFESALLEVEAIDNGPMSGVLFYRWDAKLGEKWWIFGYCFYRGCSLPI
jgi:hypothetical protein